MKSAGEQQTQSYRRRSREGAWIEINSAARHAATVASRSREGAWIEIVRYMYKQMLHFVAPRRSREGAWIEIRSTISFNYGKIQSLPRGSVD